MVNASRYIGFYSMAALIIPQILESFPWQPTPQVYQPKYFGGYIIKLREKDHPGKHWIVSLGLLLKTGGYSQEKHEMEYWRARKCYIFSLKPPVSYSSIPWECLTEPNLIIKLILNLALHFYSHFLIFQEWREYICMVILKF